MIFIFRQSSLTCEKVRVKRSIRIFRNWKFLESLDALCFIYRTDRFSYRRGKFPWKIARGGEKKKIFFFLKLGIGSFEFFFSFFELLLNIQGVLSRLICHV